MNSKLSPWPVFPKICLSQYMLHNSCQICMLPVLLATNLNYLLFHINRCLIFFLIFCCPQTAGRNINNLRYTDNTTLMAKNEEELKSLLMKVKEEQEKAGLKFNIQKTKIMVSDPITSWQIDGETIETVRNFILGGLQNHCRW